MERRFLTAQGLYLWYLADRDNWADAPRPLLADRFYADRDGVPVDRNGVAMTGTVFTTNIASPATK